MLHRAKEELNIYTLEPAVSEFKKTEEVPIEKPVFFNFGAEGWDMNSQYHGDIAIFARSTHHIR